MGKKLKKVTAMGMAVVMMCSVTACNGESTNTNKEKTLSQKEIQETVAKQEISVSETSDQYGWKLQSTELVQTNSVKNMTASDGKAYFMDEDYSTESVHIYSTDMENPDQIQNLLTISPAEDKRVSLSCLHMNQEGNLVFIKEESTIFEQVKYPEGFEKDSVVSEDALAQMEIDLSAVQLEFKDVEGMKLGEVVNMYKTLKNGENPQNSSTYSMITIDTFGNEISNLVISDMPDILLDDYAIDANGNIYFYVSVSSAGEENRINDLFIIDAKTGKTEDIPLTEEMPIILNTANHTIVELADHGNHMQVNVWDNEKKTFSGTGMTLEDVYLFSGGHNVYTGKEDSFLYVLNGNLYECNIKTNTITKILRFIDWDISESEVKFVYKTDDEHYILQLSSNQGGVSHTCLANLTRVDASEVQTKKVITLGSPFAATEETLNAVVASFNQTNPDYKVVINNYGGESFEDYDSAREAYMQNIVQGNLPDIIDISTLDLNLYKGKGMFEDLYAYIEKDSSFSQKNLNQNILSLFEDDGKLCVLPASFGICALSSAADLLSQPSLTLDATLDIIQSNPGKLLVDFYDRNHMLNMLVAYNQSYLIDTKKKTCNFTDGNFAKILEIAKSFPTSEELERSYAEPDYKLEEQKVYEGDLVFYQNYVVGTDTYETASVLFANGMNTTGYPTVDGTSIGVMATSNLFAISSNAEHKEACWQFLKMLFEATETDDYHMGLPVDNDKLDAYLEESSTPQYWTDENGVQQEIKHVINVGNMTIECATLTKEQAAQIKDMTNHTSVLIPNSYTDDIYLIVQEEAGAYFQGQKTAEDVCDVIQSRVNIMMNENN